MEPLVAKLLTQQRVLTEFGSFAFRSTDLHAILTEAASACAISLEAPYCKICRYRREHGDLLIEAGYGWHPHVVGVAVSKGDMSSPAGAAFVSRAPMICEDLPASHFVLPSFYAEHQIVSTVNVVIAGANGDNDPFGVLEIDTDKHQQFTEQDVTFLTGFANVLAEAVATNHRMDSLRTALSEKEILSRELQHRVRNNLHLIYSMLNMEAIGNGGPTRDSFETIANRVKALATVYDHLLGTGMTRTLAFNEYLEKLCGTLREFQPGSVQLTQRADATVMVDLDTATAIGIAVTEIITNAYRHAFPHGSGTIEVALEFRKVPVIRVRDDGVGIDEATPTKRRGIGLVRRLVEQVNGQFHIARAETGTECEIMLPTAAD